MYSGKQMRRILPRHPWIRRLSEFATGILAVAACGMLNRIAGGGLPYVTELPGRPMLYASVGVFIVSILLLAWWRQPGWRIPLWIAVSYAVWRTFEWGTVFDLGQEPEEAPRSPFGQLFFITGSDYADLWIRMAVGLVPGLILGAWLLHRKVLGVRLRTLFIVWLGLATAIWLAYVAAWELQERDPILLAELIAGAVWGSALISMPGLLPRREGVPGFN